MKDRNLRLPRAVLFDWDRTLVEDPLDEEAKMVGFVSLKNPWPTPGSSRTSFDPLLVTKRSG